MEEHADGMIGFIPDENALVKWTRRGVPVVNVSGAARLPQVTTIISDDRAVGREAAAHFLSRGFESFAFVYGYPKEYATERGIGFREAVSTSVPEISLGAGLPLETFLARLPASTAVFAVNDPMGREVLNTLRAIGRPAPEEVAVAAVDNDSIQSAFSPVPLSSVALSSAETGRLAAAAMAELLEGRQTPTLTLVPPGPMIERQSTNVIAVPDVGVAAVLSRIHRSACEGIRAADVLRPSDGSRRAMEIKFRRYLHRSIEDEIRRCRLETARGKVLLSQLPLSEIAEHCGYANVYHFTRSFTDAYGMSPGRMRRGQT